MFLQAATKGKNQWWRYLISIILVTFGVVLGQLPLYFYLQNQGFSDTEIEEMSATLNFEPAGIDQNLGLFFMLLAFVGGLVGLWFSVVFVHQKKLSWLITPFEKVNWRKVFYGFGFWMFLCLVAELVFFGLHPENYSFEFNTELFPGLLLVSVLVFPLQTSWEELVFRGYMMQGVSLISRWRWIPLLLTSASFGLMHMMNEEVSAFGVGSTMTYYIGTGLFLGIVTLVDDSLELALGIHAATNIYSSLFVTFDESSLKTAALFQMKSVNMQEMLVAFFASALVFIWVTSKKYNWTNWAKRCLGPVNRNQIEIV